MSILNEDGRGRSFFGKLIEKGVKIQEKYSISFPVGNREPSETALQEAQKIEEKIQQNGKGKGKATARNRTRKEEKAGTIQPPNRILPERAGGVLENREEKLQLEQSIAGVVGGPTGLLAALDVMVYDVNEKDPVGFRCDAEGYFWRLDQLQSYLKRYQEVAALEELESAALYRELLAEGDNLRKTLEGPGELTDEDLDRWRENMLEHIHLYHDEEEGDHE